MNSKRLNNIEFLRIVFTFGIVFFHIFIPLKIKTTGWMIVDFFFILSGFMLFYTNDGRDRSTLDFVKSKIIRFCPLILFGSLGMLLYKHGGCEKVLAPLFFLPATGFYEFDFIGTGSTWYLSVLFWVSIFLFNLNKIKEKQVVNIIIGVLVFYSYIACVKYGWGMAESIGNKGTLLYLFTKGMARGIGGMGLGYLFASFYIQNRTEENPKISPYYTFFEIAFFVLCFFMMFDRHVCPKNKMFLVAVEFCIIACFILKKGFFSTFLEKYNYDRVSKYMLSLFLTHQIVINRVYAYFKDICNIENMILLMLILSIVLAVLVHHFVEKPGAKLLKYVFFQSEKDYKS